MLAESSARRYRTVVRICPAGQPLRPVIAPVFTQLDLLGRNPDRSSASPDGDGKPSLFVPSQCLVHTLRECVIDGCPDSENALIGVCLTRRFCMPYTRLLYHLVWATYEREPWLNTQRSAWLSRILGGKAAELGVFVHTIGNVSDHVHLVVGIPPTLAVSECVGQLKGASSHALNHHAPPFRWQEGYGAVTLCDEILGTVIAYVRNQKRHHRVGSVEDRLERDTAASP